MFKQVVSKIQDDTSVAGNLNVSEDIVIFDYDFTNPDYGVNPLKFNYLNATVQRLPKCLMSLV